MNRIPAMFARVLLIIFVISSTVGSSFANHRTDKITLKARDPSYMDADTQDKIVALIKRQP